MRRLRLVKTLYGFLLLLACVSTAQAQQTLITGVLPDAQGNPDPHGELYLYQSTQPLSTTGAIRITTDSEGRLLDPKSPHAPGFKVPRNSQIRVFSTGRGLNSCRASQPCSASVANGVWLTVPDVADYTLEAMAGESLTPATFGNPMVGLGDSIYGSTGGVATRLPGNMLAAKRWLRQTGTGSASAAPAWDQPGVNDIAGLYSSNPQDGQRLVYNAANGRYENTTVGGGDAVWGSIGGTLGDQGDLADALADKANTGHTHTLSQITDAGTAAAKNAPGSGNAASGEVVLGNDNRLTDARTPAAHAPSHAAAGSDPLTVSQSQVSGLTAALTAKQDALGFTPENVANKSTGFGTLNNTLYPTTQAVANYAQPLSSVLTTYAGIAPSANVQALLGTADFAAFRSSLGLGSLATQSGTFSGTSSGTNTGDQTSVSGNAGTATALQTARNINGVAFDGTANVTVTAAAGTLTGATLSSNVLASSLTSVGTITSGGLGTGAVIGGVTMTLGSDASGDIYYRSSGGLLTRLAKGSDGQVLMLASGLPSWATAGGGLTVGTTTITSGANTKVLFNNSGVVGEYAISGTGNVVMSASPTLTGTVAMASATISGTIQAPRGGNGVPTYTFPASVTDGIGHDTGTSLLIITGGQNTACVLGGNSGVFQLGASGLFGWGPTTDPNGAAKDTAWARAAASIIRPTDGSTGGGALEFKTMSAPSSPSTGFFRFYAKDNGSGKVQVVVKFSDGTETVLATQP
jgi:hypothetical protein